MEKTVLLYHFDRQKAQRIKKALARHAVSVREVAPEEYSLPLGILAGLPGSFLFGPGGSSAREAAGETEGDRKQATVPDQEMLVFAGITRQELDHILETLRKNALSGIALKAMLTETNRFWNGIQLFAELKKEHMLMHRNAEITND